MARIRVGTDNPSEQIHPLIHSVTPDGRELIVPNVRANNVSIVNTSARSPANQTPKSHASRSSGLTDSQLARGVPRSRPTAGMR